MAALKNGLRLRLASPVAALFALFLVGTVATGFAVLAAGTTNLFRSVAPLGFWLGGLLVAFLRDVRNAHRALHQRWQCDLSVLARPIGQCDGDRSLRALRSAALSFDADARPWTHADGQRRLSGAQVGLSLI